MFLFLLIHGRKRNCICWQKLEKGRTAGARQCCKEHFVMNVVWTSLFLAWLKDRNTVLQRYCDSRSFQNYIALWEQPFLSIYLYGYIPHFNKCEMWRRTISYTFTHLTWSSDSFPGSSEELRPTSPPGVISGQFEGALFSRNLCHMTVTAGNFFARDQSLPLKYHIVPFLCYLAMVTSAVGDKENGQNKWNS